MYKYANDWEEYIIQKVVREGCSTYWVITQDGVFANGRYKTLKDAKKAVDNQEVRF